MSFVSLFPAPQKAKQDRRSARRRRPDQLVYADFGPHNGGIVIDVSEGGLQFQSVDRITLGDSLPVTFVLTGAVGTIKTTAKVVWCNDTGKGGGLKLLDLPKTVRNEISAWVSSDPSPAAEKPAAKGNGRASFNLLTTEGRVTPRDPVSDEAAMAVARLLVSARGHSKSDPEPQATIPVHDLILNEVEDADVHDSEVHDGDVHDGEVHSDEVRDGAPNEPVPMIAAPAAAVPETQTEIAAIAEATAESIPEQIVPSAEPAPPVELAPAVKLVEQSAGPAEDALEMSAEAPVEVAAAETPVESLAGEAVADAAANLAPLSDATAAEVTAAEVTSEILAEVPAEATGEVSGKVADEVADEVPNEVTPDAAAVAEISTESSVETLLETVPEASEASLSDAAETAVLSRDAAPEPHANADANVQVNSDAEIPAPLPESAVNCTATQSENVDASPSPAPMPQADTISTGDIAEGIAAEIAPAIADEIVEGVVAGLESKSEGPAKIATNLETVALHADPEGPAAALVEILLSAAAQATPVAPPSAPIPVTARTAPAPPKAASTEPISIARKAKDARVPNFVVFGKSTGDKKFRKFGKRKKTSPTIRESMRGFSIFSNPDTVAAPAVVPVRSAAVAAAPAVHLPGWGAQVLKFAVGVGVGCCLLAGAFVGLVLLDSSRRPLSLAGTSANGVAEASAPIVTPTLDVEVIDLNSRRWHLNDSTPDAVPFAPQNPVVELTPGDAQPTARASAPVPAGPAAKLPAAKSLAPKLPVAKSPAAKSIAPPAPKAPVAVSANANSASAPIAPVPTQPAPILDSPAKSASAKSFALASPAVARGVGNSTDAGAPSLTESISSFISYPMSSAVVGDSAPADPRTPVSSKPVFPSVLLLPPVRHNTDFHVAAPIRQDNPTYPSLAKRLQITGTVRIDAFVGKDGRAHSLKVISGDPRLSSATLAAVSNWTFRPAQLDGESVESEVTISVNFDLH